MNISGCTQETIEDKLIIMYVVEKAVSLTDRDLIRIILHYRLMNYFILQQSVDELVKDRFLDTSDNNNVLSYKVNTNGRKILQYFSGKIPLGIKSLIDKDFKSILKEVRDENSVKADFIPENENHFIVNCSINEKDVPLLEVNISVGTKNDARNIINNWKEFSQDIYKDIIEVLTRQRGIKDS